jgi:hypothetical protein
METAEMYLQTLPTHVLLAALRGEVDLNELAKQQLVNRGLDSAGKWVGFAESARIMAESAGK